MPKFRAKPISPIRCRHLTEKEKARSDKYRVTTHDKYTIKNLNAVIDLQNSASNDHAILFPLAVFANLELYVDPTREIIKKYSSKLKEINQIAQNKKQLILIELSDNNQIPLLPVLQQFLTNRLSHIIVVTTNQEQLHMIPSNFTILMV